MLKKSFNTAFPKTRSIYYIGGAAGLPIAAMLGNYAADVIIDKADKIGRAHV